MRMITIPAAALLALAAFGTAAPALAKGCIKGAVAGGVAGHMMHHHGLIGAGIGCAIGHHEAAKRAREDAASQRDQAGQHSDTGR